MGTQRLYTAIYHAACDTKPEFSGKSKYLGTVSGRNGPVLSRRPAAAERAIGKKLPSAFTFLPSAELLQCSCTVVWTFTADGSELRGILGRLNDMQFEKLGPPWLRSLGLG